MKIRNDIAKGVVMDFITETFNGFDFSFANVAGLVAVKLFINNNFDKILPIISQNGYIDIDSLEQIAMPEIEKLGKFEINGIGTKYSFGVDDVKKLIAKMKQKGEQ
jgi:hypothetical protein